MNLKEDFKNVFSKKNKRVSGTKIVPDKTQKTKE